MAEKNEKRDSRRVRQALPIIYANLGLSDPAAYQYQRTAILDISETGIGLTVDEPIQKDDLIQVVLTIPVKPFIITGLTEAVWAEPVPGTNKYRAGLRFIQCPIDLTQDLLEMIR